MMCFFSAVGSGIESIVKILGVVVGIIPVGLREADMVGADKLSDLKPDLVENMSPASSVLGTEHLGFFLVHFQICSENGFS